MTRPIFRLLLLVLALPVSCGGDDDEGGTSYTVACSDVCDRYARCSSSIDAQACTTDCRDQYAAIGPNLSGAYVDALSQCLTNQNCGGLVVSQAFNLCELQARGQVEASTTVQAFCERVGEADQFCNRVNRQVACVAFLDIFSDAAVARANACLDRPCDQQEPCVEEELGTLF